jgi:hypothetical protein
VYSIILIRSHKIFSFCEQTLKMAANDASGQGLQSTPKNRHKQKIYKSKTDFLISYFHVMVLVGTL